MQIMKTEPMNLPAVILHALLIESPVDPLPL